LRCSVVSANRRFLIGRPIPGFQAGGTYLTVECSARLTHEPCDWLTADHHHRLVWEPTRSRTVRAVWNAGGGRCYSQLPASVDSYPGASLCFGKDPVGPLHVEQALLAKEKWSYSPRMLTPLVARAAHWRSLNQDVPTSDALCRLTGTTRRLQGDSPLPLHALLVLRQGDPRASD